MEKETDSYNQKLSQERASLLLEYLKNNGIAEDRMAAKAMGKDMPAAPNRTLKEKTILKVRQLNRRTQFRIVKDDSKRRILFDSNKPGNIDNKQISESG
ncbi:MAG: OmpA family protein [Chitinophagaceae bacterium]